MARARRSKAKAKRKNSNYHNSANSKNNKQVKNSRGANKRGSRRKTADSRKNVRAQARTSTAAGITLALSAVFFSFLIVIQVYPAAGSFSSPSDIFGFLRWGGAPAVTVAQGELAVHYVDVGQGDCEIIKTADRTVLIDCGEERYADSVIAYIKSLGTRRLDYVIATHPHDDHIGGMAKILDAFQVGMIIMPRLPSNMVPTTKSFENMLDTIERKNIDAVYAKPGDEYGVGAGGVLKLLSPLHNDYNGLNNFSVACRLSHGENSFIFCGDIERASESDILNNGEYIGSDVLKVAHHGSTSSSTPAFLRRVSPRYAVIEVGQDNAYGHPTETVLERLDDVGAEVFCTSEYGDIVFVSDGMVLSIYTEKGEENAA